MSKDVRANEAVPELAFISPGEAYMLREPEWLVEGILPANSLALWYGPPDTYKTFAAIDLAACIGSGTRWHGHDVRKPGVVGYIVAEGEDAFPSRLEAWATAHGVSRDATRVYQLHQAVNVLHEGWMTSLIAAILRLKEQAGDVRLVVIDTLSMCLHGGQMVGDMGEVSISLNWVRRATGATILLMHHTNGAGSRARGDSALEGNYPVRVRFDPDGAWASTLTCEKMSNAPKFKDITLRYGERPVTLHSGRETTSLTVLPDAAEPSTLPSARGGRHSMRDYLAVVRTEQPVELGAIAARLQVSRQAAFSNMNRAKQSKWVTQDAEHHYSLTFAGKRRAA